ncbi:hypothetical protein MACH09_25900 [Vibrio sp. MACH09]|nr:hypothetical protein MACH09_25900 [Vibrio sp. MACH09]
MTANKQALNGFQSINSSMLKEILSLSALIYQVIELETDLTIYVIAQRIIKYMEDDKCLLSDEKSDNEESNNDDK